MAEESRPRLRPRENDDQTPVNVAGMEYWKIKSWEVAEWHDTSDGSGDPTAVIVLIFLDEEEEEANLDPACFQPSPPLILRLKTRKAADEFIVALMTHSKAIWPDDPVTCEGFDPDAICKCGRRIEDHAKGNAP